MVFFFISFFKFIFFYFFRNSTSGGVEGGRERQGLGTGWTRDPKQALYWEQTAGCGTQTKKLRDHGLSPSPMFNWLNHPGALKVTFWRHSEYLEPQDCIICFIEFRVNSLQSYHYITDRILLVFLFLCLNVLFMWELIHICDKELCDATLSYNVVYERAFFAIQTK